ncbi:MAG TPA: hypothetical protein PKL37_23135 [Panacibacter sp.]|nr:hypothetical protein [Panacibacter sp.]
MRKFLCLFFFFITVGCNNSTDDKNYNQKKGDVTNYSDKQANIGFIDRLDSTPTKFMDMLIDSGMKDGIENDIALIESSIDKVCDSALIFLEAVKDTAVSYGLIQSFKLEKATFKSDLYNESQFIFMSYGKLSTAHEDRQAAANGYYYLALKEKNYFLRKVYENAKDNLEFP